MKEWMLAHPGLVVGAWGLALLSLALAAVLLWRTRVLLRASASSAPSAADPSRFGRGTDVAAPEPSASEAARRQQRLEATAKAAGLGMWEWLPQEGVEHFDARCAALVGLGDAPVTVTTPGFQRVLLPEDREASERGVDDVLAGRSATFEQEFRVRDDDGEWRWRLDRGLVVEWTPDGRPLRMLGVTLDVDARKRAEIDLLRLNGELEARIAERTTDLVRARDEAERASRAKSEFLSRMSHEMRTPLTGVLGTLELLLETRLDPGQRRFGQLAQCSAGALLALISDVLDFSSVESGQLELEEVEFDLAGLVHDSTSALASQARERGLQFVAHVDPAIPGRLTGDPGRIRQVLLNLAGNAVKFTERGEVRVGVSVDPARSDPAAGRVALDFEVRDTGIGIPAELQEGLFAAFAQADASMTRRHGGTGLGLAISQELVEMMGGRIRVDSEPGRGAVFSFGLTLRAARPGEEEGPLAEGTDGELPGAVPRPRISAAR